MIYYGTVISEKDIDLIENVDFEIETCGINAKVKAIHHIVNPTSNPLNATITTTFDDECSVIGFVMENDKVITSELKKKEEAKQEQSDATSSGYSSTVMEKTDDTTFSLSLGLLQPHKLVKVTIEYLTQLQTNEDGVVIKLQSPIQKKVPFSINLTGTTSFKFKGELTGEEEIEINKEVNGIIIMKDEDTDEIVTSSTFVNKEEEGDIEVIFVCDRSGSMNGDGITALKETLQLFLRQLPLDCKFNIISFGSSFDSMFPSSIQYNDQSLEQSSKKITTFSANYGGTNMYGPLEKAMKQKCHIIALTDGSLSDKAKVLQLCKQDKDNVVHSVGLGRNVDIQTVRDMARLTGGISVISKNPKHLKSAVSKITQRILTPTLSDINIKWSLQGDSYPKNIAKMNNNLSVYLSLNDDIDNEQLKSLTCTLNGKIGDKIITLTNTNPSITNGILLHQLLAAQKIKEAETNNDIATAVKLSLRYNVLSRHTAFIAIDKSSKHEVKDIKVVKLNDIKYHYNANMPTFGGRGGRMANTTTRRSAGKPRKLAKMSDSDKEKKTSQPPILVEDSNEERVIGSSCPINAARDLQCVMTPEMKRKSDFAPISGLQEKQVEMQLDKKKHLKKKSKGKDEVHSFGNVPAEKVNDNDMLLNNLIQLQKADGRFINMDMYYPTIKNIITKYSSINQDLIQTFFATQIFIIKFSNDKVQWSLLVKKANKFLLKNPIEDTIKNEIISLVKSL
ncbi:VWFA domain-containing protein [Entamoeba marina]